MLRKGDKVIIAKRDDVHLGRSTVIRSISGVYADLTIDGTAVRYQLSDLSAIPAVVGGELSNSKWKLTVLFYNDPPLSIEYSERPAITWSNGMIKIEADNEIELFQMSDVSRIRVSL
jgi:hypothetical protein